MKASPNSYISVTVGLQQGHLAAALERVPGKVLAKAAVSQLIHQRTHLTE